MGVERSECARRRELSGPAPRCLDFEFIGVQQPHSGHAGMFCKHLEFPGLKRLASPILAAAAGGVGAPSRAAGAARRELGTNPPTQRHQGLFLRAQNHPSVTVRKPEARK